MKNIILIPNSYAINKRIILTLSSLSIDKQTVPDGYTLGWKKAGGNLHFGGLLG